ncbi:hypothetical protein, partial [Methanococcoides seepicolus]
SATVTITNATDPLENTISIDSVDIITRNAGKNLFVSAKAVVTIQNDVAGNTVSGSWSGATTDVDSSLTDGSGTLTFYSNEVKYKTKALTFTFNVDGSSLSATYPQ